MIRQSSFILALTLLAIRGGSLVIAQDDRAKLESTADPMKEQRLRERDELWQQAQTLQSEGKLAEAIAVGERVLAIERELFRGNAWRADRHAGVAFTAEAG